MTTADERRVQREVLERFSKMFAALGPEDRVDGLAEMIMRMFQHFQVSGLEALHVLHLCMASALEKHQHEVVEVRSVVGSPLGGEMIDLLQQVIAHADGKAKKPRGKKNSKPTGEIIPKEA